MANQNFFANLKAQDERAIQTGTIVADDLGNDHIAGDVFVRNDANNPIAVTSQNSPIRYNLDGVETEVSEDTATPANSTPLPVKVLDGVIVVSNPGAGDLGNPVPAQAILSGFEDPSGNLSSASVNASGQLVTEVVSSALPNGAATEATLAALAAEDFSTETTLVALSAKVTAVDTDSVTVVSSALPTGAATEATLAGILADTSSIAAVDFSTETTLSALNGKFGSLGQKAMAGSAPVVIAS